MMVVVVCFLVHPSSFAVVGVGAAVVVSFVFWMSRHSGSSPLVSVGAAGGGVGDLRLPLELLSPSLTVVVVCFLVYPSSVAVVGVVGGGGGDGGRRLFLGPSFFLCCCWCCCWRQWW